MRRPDALRLGAAIFAIAALFPLTASASAPHVEQADLTGDINNIAAAYIASAVSRAEADRADALLVVLNTPGGISTSMDDIVTSLLNSKVPVIVYVYPSGARGFSTLCSSGTLLTIRLVTAYDTTARDVDGLLDAVAAEAAQA